MKKSVEALIWATVFLEAGLRRLIGDWPAPTLDELEEVLTERPKALKRPDVPFEEVLTAVGGWPAIVDAVERWRWRKVNRLAWNIFVEVSDIRVYRAISRLKGKPRWQILTEKYDLTPKTLRLRAQQAVEGIADEILAGVH